MSVINEAYATPSRISGAYRLLLQARGNRMNRGEFEKALSPQSIKNDPSDRNEMIHKVVNEAVKMGLFQKDDSDIFLAEELPKALKEKTKGDRTLPFYAVDLLFSSTNDENHNFAWLLTWYLSQDVHDAPGDWKEAEDVLNKQVGQHKLGCNDVWFGQFVYWSRYCGFAWMYDIDRQRLTPDPTVYLSWLLAEIFSKETTLTFDDVVQKIAERCPVFEEGKFRVSMEREYQFEKRKPRFLSSVTSHAWLRLHEEGYVELELKSDADVYVVVENEIEHRYSHVTWKRKKERF